MCVWCVWCCVEVNCVVSGVIFVLGFSGLLGEISYYILVRFSVLIMERLIC